MITSTQNQLSIALPTMEIIKDHWMRVLYIISICFLCYLGYTYQKEIVTSANPLDKVSYWGTIATVAALLVTLVEVFHNIHITKRISQQAKKMLLESRKIDSASLVSESNSSLDDTNNYISIENYSVALKCFQQFRKSYARIYYTDEFSQSMNSLVNSTELSLQKAVHTSAEAPLPKRTKTLIQKDILEIKNTLENTKPSKEH